MLVKIQARLGWRWTREGKNGQYIGVCDPLGITVCGETYSDLLETMDDAIGSVLREMLSTNELDRFLRDRGWTADSTVPVGMDPRSVHFDVPFEVVQAALPA